MGTTSSKSSKTPKADPVVKEKKVYSWEKKKTIDRSNYIVSKKSGEVIVKHPGSLNGEQFCIEECNDCEIFAYDHNTSVTIDQCVNCKIYIGPCESSIFIRDCKDCSFMVACQQFRARNLANCQLWLYSATEPVLEISPDLKIACFNVGYPQLKHHLDKAKLNIWNNRYSEVHNFTPEHSFTVLSLEEQDKSEPQARALFEKHQVTESNGITMPPLPLGTAYNGALSIPLSIGIPDRKNKSSVVVFIMSDKNSSEAVKTTSMIVAPSVSNSTTNLSQEEEEVVKEEKVQVSYLEYNIKQWMLNILPLLTKQDSGGGEKRLQLIQSRRTIISEEEKCQKLISLSIDKKLNTPSASSPSDDVSTTKKALSPFPLNGAVEVVGLEFACNDDNTKENVIEIVSELLSNSTSIMWCISVPCDKTEAVDLFFDEWREKI